MVTLEQDGTSVALPSEDIYALFDGGLKCNTEEPDECCEHSGNNVRTLLQVWLRGALNLASEIEQTYCYACAMEQGEPNGDWCHLFYYWLGTKIKGILNNRDFADIMRRIYSKLPGDQCRSYFNNLYDDVGQHVFENSKELFDNDYDYRALQPQLGGYTYPRCLRYNGNLGRVRDAYSQLCNICGEGDGDKYCKKFKVDHWGGKQWKQQKLPELTCSNEGEPKQDEEDEEELLESGSRPQELGLKPPAIVGGTMSINLPSSNEYQNFELSWEPHSKNGTVSTIKGALQSALRGKLNNYNCINKIAGVWYYITDVMYKKSSSYDKRCDFFYYWLGSTVLDNLKEGSSFQNAMYEIYTKLQESSGRNECPTITTTVDGVTFVQRKRMFDYWHDHSTIRTLVQKSGSSCDQQYGSYLGHIHAAYAAVEKGYEGGSDEYWYKFWSKNKNAISEELSNLTCNRDSGSTGTWSPGSSGTGSTGTCNQNCDTVSGGEGKGGSDGGGSHRKEGEEAQIASSIIPGALSGALAAVGLPTITFFLYKVST
ncbi:KIR protein [Plasmodium coatneyi]|uniref:KIR protein n=1 Tax=Plasmodium coatneyi TaxID=208452 RepID=A0A1B1E549_9APIC|nr:KIR protein [Plasmodium coatneyi]ANQ10126.1 KIR protein [Plasmodium coatneyi]